MKTADSFCYHLRKRFGLTRKQTDKLVPVMERRSLFGRDGSMFYILSAPQECHKMIEYMNMSSGRMLISEEGLAIELGLLTLKSSGK